MDVLDFVPIAKGLFERTGKLEERSTQLIWQKVLDNAEIAVCREILEELAYQGERFPSPRVFHDMLATRIKPIVDMDEAFPEKSEQCSVCDGTIRYYRANDEWRRMRGSGWLLFREWQGQWYAMRCWKCGGPEEYWAWLPVPQQIHRPHWKPEAETPLRALRIAYEKSSFEKGVLDRGVDQAAFVAWLRAAEENTQSAQVMA